MQKPEYRSALIVGTGPGLSASLARLFAKHGLAVSLAARQTDKLAALAKETGAEAHACNAADPKEVAGLFETLDAKGRTPDVVVYNASNRVRGPLVDLAPDDVKRAIEISAFGGFLVSQQAAKRMLPQVARRHLPDRRHGRREGLRAVGHLRHGQVRAARARAIDGARAFSPRASMSPIS